MCSVYRYVFVQIITILSTRFANNGYNVIKFKRKVEIDRDRE